MESVFGIDRAIFATLPDYANCCRNKFTVHTDLGVKSYYATVPSMQNSVAWFSVSMLFLLLLFINTEVSVCLFVCLLLHGPQWSCCSCCCFL